jgi:hypothetical protein
METLPKDGVFLRAGATCQEAELSPEAPRSSWAPGDGTQFKVRKGPSYARTGAKDLSLSNMYELVALDNFRTEQRLYPVTPLIDLPPLSEHAKKWKHPHVPATVVLNIQIPDVPAKIFGVDIDAATMHVIAYYQIREETIAALTSGQELTPGHTLWAEWCQRAFVEEKFRGRLKMIGVVENYRKLGLPSLLEGYNGKPAIIFKTGSLVRGKVLLPTVKFSRACHACHSLCPFPCLPAFLLKFPASSASPCC